MALTPAAHIFEREWDLLVVLDALRADLAAAELADSAAIEGMDVVWSAGSNTAAWIATNFREAYAGECADTAYVTANPHSERIPDGRLAHREEVWRTHWDADLGTVPPRPVTDYALHARALTDVGRLIVHYVQPHFPALHEPGLGGRWDPDEEGWPDSIWRKLAAGDADPDVVWDAYAENFRRVFQEVELLRGALDFDVGVVTADHGNLFGDRGLYGHPQGADGPAVKCVPWFELDPAADREYTPETEYIEAGGDADVEERLAALGYRGG